MDRKRRYVHTLSTDGLDIFNSDEAQDLAQIRLHGIPGSPRPLTKDAPRTSLSRVLFFCEWEKNRVIKCAVSFKQKRRVTSEETARMTLSAFQLASKAAEIFENGTAVQKRVILETAGSNYQLKSKKVLYELKNPLRIIAEAGSRLEWCDR